MATIRNLIIRIGASTRGVESGMERTERAFKATARAAEKLDASATHAARAIDNVGDQAVQLAGQLRLANAAMSNSFTRSTSMVAKFGAVLAGIGVVAAGVGAGAAAAIGAVSLGFLGLGAAIAAQNKTVQKDWKAVFKTIKDDAAKLAQPFVGPMRQVAGIFLGTWKAIRGGLGEIFRDFAPTLVPLARGLSAMFQEIFGALVKLASATKPMLLDLAGSLQRLGQAVAAFLEPITRVLKVEAKDAFSTLLGGLGMILVALGPVVAAFASFGLQAIGPVLAALAQIVVALGPVINALLGGLLPVIKAILPMVVGLAQAFSAALVPILRELGPIVAQSLNMLYEPLVAVVRILGQGFLAVVQQLGPYLPQLAGMFGQVLGAIAPLIMPFTELIGPAAQLAYTLGRALIPVIQAVVTVAGPLVTAIGGLLTAISPLLVPVGLLVAQLITGLVPVFQQLLPALAAVLPPLIMLGMTLAQALVPVIGAVVAAAIPLIGAIGQIATAIAPLLPPLAALVAQLITGLVPVLVPLIPVLAQMAVVVGQFLVTALSTLLAAIRPILPQLMAMAVTIGRALLTALIQAAPSLMQIVNAFVALLPTLIPLIPAFTQLAVQWIAILPPILQLAAVVLSVLVPALKFLLPLLVLLAKGGFGFVILQLKIVTAEVRWFAKNFAVILGGAVLAVFKLFKWLYDKLVGHSIIPDLINGILRWVGKLPGRIMSLFSRAASWLYGAGRSILIGLWNGVASMAGWIARSIGNLIRRIIPGPVRRILGIASPSRLFAFFGRMLGEGLVLGMDATQAMVSGAAGRLAIAAQPALSAPGVGMVAPEGVTTPSGGGGQANDPRTWAEALADAMERRGLGAVYLDGNKISDSVSRRTGRATDQRRRTG